MADALAGGLTGGLAGLSTGLSLVYSIGAKAVVSTGVEAYKQLAKDAITGCVEDGRRDLIFAFGGGLVGGGIGNFAGSAAAESSTAITHVIQESSEVVEALVGNTLEGSAGLGPALAKYVRHHP